MDNLQKKILVVDDQYINRLFLNTLLDYYSLDSEFANNGQEAVNTWEKEDFKAIFMDLEMPVMGGLEAARIIRQREKEENRPHTPIYAISATTMADPHLECSKAGMDGFIAKPIVIDEILDVILPLVS